MADRNYYLGNLRRLIALPSPGEDVKSAPVRAGAVLTALNGRKSRQTFGVTRSWAFSFTNLDETECADIEAIDSGAVPGPLYLFDPTRRNILARELASATSVKPGVGWTTEWTATLSVVDDFTTPIERCASTVRVVNTGGGNYVRRKELPTRGEPIRAGVPVTFSAYVRQDVGTVTPYLQFRDHNGSDLGASVNGASSTATAWERRSVTATPPAGAVYVEAGFVGGADFTISFTACQLEHSSTATEWVPGSGVPRVIIESLDITNPRFGLYTADVTITEI